MTSLDAGDRIGIALGWAAGLLVLPWFWMARGVIRVLEKLNNISDRIGLPFLALIAAFCAFQILTAGGCVSVSDANRAAAQEDAVLRAWNKAAEEAGE